MKRMFARVALALSALTALSALAGAQSAWKESAAVQGVIMLTVTGLTKSFATPDGPARVVDEVGFTVAERECYALLGPSGCGKTTTLRCIAGLEPIDRGTIAIGSTQPIDSTRANCATRGLGTTRSVGIAASVTR